MVASYYMFQHNVVLKIFKISDHLPKNHKGLKPGGNKNTELSIKMIVYSLIVFICNAFPLLYILTALFMFMFM